MNLAKKQKQNQGHREQTSGCQEGKGWQKVGVGVWDQQIQTDIYRNNKVLLYSKENHIQYPLISHNGKEYKKECVCVCVCIVTYIYN